MIQSKPLISIVVPIYNASKYLRRLMESLVYQTLENIEIICVDKASEDDSFEILSYYQKQFPDKVFIYEIPYSNTPAAGRNYGIERARADYIAFSDADDMFEFNAMERLYKETLKEDYDIIWYQFYNIVDGVKTISNKLNFPLDRGELIRNANVSFWNKLIRKDVLKAFGPIPEDTIFDDMAYTITLVLKVKKQGYVACPLYHHIVRNDSESSSSQSRKMKDVIPASEAVMKEVSPIFLNDAIFRVVKWLLYSIKFRWICLDECVDFLKKYEDFILENPYLKLDKSSYNAIKKYLKLSDDKIPERVFLNGFKQNITNERLEEIRNKAFINNPEIIVLNELNCDISENKIIYDIYVNGNNADFIGEYFALKNIYESGGVYIGPHIRMELPLNTIRRNTAFVSMINDKEYSSEIFGGVAGNNLFKIILQTYEYDFYSDVLYPLDKRIKNIITTCFANLKKDTFSEQGIYILSPYSTCLIRNKTIPKTYYHFCSHIFNDKVGCPGYVTIRERDYTESNMILPTTPTTNMGNVSTNDNEIIRLKRQLAEIQDSIPWKIISHIKKKRNTTCGKLIFYIYNNLIKKVIFYYQSKR